MAVVNIYKKAVAANSVKMKIALVCPYDIAYPGGVTSHVTQFAQYARKAGHAVTVIAPASRKGAYEGVISAGKAIPLPIKGGTVPRLSFSFWNYPEIRKLFVSEKFDVIHVHEPGVPLLGFAALGCAPQRLSAIAATFHTNAPYNFLYKTYGKIAKVSRLADKLLRKVDVKIAVSEAAKRFASRYVSGEYFIIPNGVDLERFSPKAKPIGHYTDGKVNVLFVGRLGNYEKRKGLKYLVSAFNKLHANHPNARLLVVGPGKPDSETKKMAKAANNKSIVFVGEVSAEQLPRYYATADIFCSPATHGESFGMVLAEAMASGKPVVASNIDGYRNVVLGSSRNINAVSTDGLVRTEAGILVPPRNPQALADALEQLLSNEALRLSMGESGRRIVVNNFSWEKVAAAILEVYEQAIAAKRQRKIVTAKV